MKKKNKKKRKGQIVNKSKSNGLGVCQMWVKLFEQNEKNARTGKFNKVLIDSEITVAMLKAFPGRKESQILYLVNKVRNRYNRGLLTGGKKPKQRSRKYVVDGSGNWQIIASKKRKGKTNGSRN